MPAELPFPDRNSRQALSYAPAAPRRPQLSTQRPARRGRPERPLTPATSGGYGPCTLPAGAREPTLLRSRRGHGLEHAVPARAFRGHTPHAVTVRQMFAAGAQRPPHPGSRS